MKTEIREVSTDDPRIQQLMQAVGDAIADAQDQGLNDQLCLHAAAIAVTECGRIAFGDDFIHTLCETMKLQRGKPLADSNLEEISH